MLRFGQVVYGKDRAVGRRVVDRGDLQLVAGIDAGDLDRRVPALAEQGATAAVLDDDFAVLVSGEEVRRVVAADKERETERRYE